jgi:glycosyltransferase involved in cell wall biosynthesis
MFASVIICTHNPTLNYLNRTICALKEQTLPFTDWELIVVDNASERPVADYLDLSWHPFGRHVSEQKLGSAYARIKGIEEADSATLIFVDDDNCLKQNYLETALEFMQFMPLIGAIGAGKIVAEFETPPSEEVIPFLRSLAIRSEDRPCFSNDIKYHKAIPYGAGLCIRRSIALAYTKHCSENKITTSLGRVGNILLSAEDIDLALHACKAGYISGVIPELELIHLIPRRRIEHDYLVKIAAGHAASSYILSQLWKFQEYPEHPLLKWGRYWKNRIKSTGLARKILIAEYIAEKDAMKTWRALTENNSKFDKLKSS